MRALQQVALGIMLLGAATLTGCGKTGPHLEPVQGRVTLAGGEWPSRGTLTFAPLQAEAGLPQVPGWADFEPDGQFVARCSTGTGLVPGEYVVNVVCVGEGAGHDGKPVASKVSPNYPKKPHKLIVERNRSGELVLDIPKG